MKLQDRSIINVQSSKDIEINLLLHPVSGMISLFLLLPEGIYSLTEDLGFRGLRMEASLYLLPWWGQHHVSQVTKVLPAKKKVKSCPSSTSTSELLRWKRAEASIPAQCENCVVLSHVHTPKATMIFFLIVFADSDLNILKIFRQLVGFPASSESTFYYSQRLLLCRQPWLTHVGVQHFIGSRCLSFLIA